MRASLFLLPAVLLSLSAPAFAAEEAVKQDDKVVLDLSAENWVTTQTARVIINVEAAVSGSSVGTARNEMMKIAEGISKADWKLISFNRSQDQTGMERWSAQFEARLNENALGGLNDAAKKASRAGMQATIAAVDFTPTLDETQKAYGSLRTQLYKDASEQLKSLNEALPGKSYRISLINFTSSEEGAPQAPRPMLMRTFAKASAASNEMMTAGAAPNMERAEKINITAHVVFSARP